MTDEMIDNTVKKRDDCEKEQDHAETVWKEKQVKTAKRKWRWVTAVCLVFFILAGNKVYLLTAHWVSPLQYWRCRESFRVIAEYAMDDVAKNHTADIVDISIHPEYSSVPMPDEVAKAWEQICSSLRYPVKEIGGTVYTSGTLSGCIEILYGADSACWPDGYVKNSFVYIPSGKISDGMTSYRILVYMGDGWYNTIRWDTRYF